jgi:hypothetical protein
VVAQDAHLAPAHDLIQALTWIGTIPDNVTQTVDLRNTLAPDVVQNYPQGFHVPVDVAYQCPFQNFACRNSGLWDAQLVAGTTDSLQRKYKPFNIVGQTRRLQYVAGIAILQVAIAGVARVLPRRGKAAGQRQLSWVVGQRDEIQRGIRGADDGEQRNAAVRGEEKRAVCG